jgi:hypothetical protein
MAAPELTERTRDRRRTAPHWQAKTAVAFVNSDGGLVTPAHAANPGDIVVFWGTGLGPVTSDETEPAVEANMPDIPLQVFLGGQQAEILFQGRNACCSSIDTVYVQVPEGIGGCAVPVNMQIGSTPNALVSHGTSIAVAATGRTCTPVTPTPMGPGTFGTFGLIRFISTQIRPGTSSPFKPGDFEPL